MCEIMKKQHELFMHAIMNDKGVSVSHMSTKVAKKMISFFYP